MPAMPALWMVKPGGGRMQRESKVKKTLEAIAEHGAESPSVVITNGQLLFSGAKQPPHGLP